MSGGLDSEAFCDWAGLALPSDAQWEKAARGTGALKYPWGNEDPTPDRCVWKDHPTYGGKSTAPVGSCPRGVSPYGAFDMAGNVWESCADWFDEKAYGRYARGDTTPPKTGVRRVVRGGSWMLDAGVARAAFRGGGDPGRGASVGLRPCIVQSQ